MQNLQWYPGHMAKTRRLIEAKPTLQIKTEQNCGLIGMQSKVLRLFR